MNTFNSINNYLYKIDFLLIQGRGLSLPEITVLTIFLEKLGLTILYKKITQTHRRDCIERKENKRKHERF